MNPMDDEQPDELREQIFDLVIQFTDDYIDEWVAKGNDLTKLHEITDNHIDTLLGLIAHHTKEAVTRECAKVVENVRACKNHPLLQPKDKRDWNAAIDYAADYAGRELSAPAIPKTDMEVK